MRPLRLELQGFTSFRDHTEIDFGDAEYFVMAGPTGSGKSTIVDAICFALYGSVPRYGHRGLVAPVITQGQLEAKVRLDFSVDGTPYTAVRVVRRSGSGATTKEARLECRSEVIAGTADELTQAVTEIVGLSFDHFTKCVVLPQGEFARFLHDKPADRQDMLVRLLSLGIYELMRQMAHTEAVRAKSERNVVEQRLENEFNDYTKETLEEAEMQVRKLEGLRRRVDEAMPELEVLTDDMAAAEADADRTEGWIELLTSLEVPEEMAAFGDEMAHALKALAEAEEMVKGASESVVAAEAARKELPERAPLADAASAHRRRAALLEAAVANAKALEKLEAAEAKARTSLEVAAARHDKALEAEAAAREAHAALHLSASLSKGEQCPVCLQRVKELPEHPSAPRLERAQAAVEQKAAARKEAESKLTDASNVTVAKRAEGEADAKQLDALSEELESYPDPEDVDKRLALIDAVDKEIDRVRSKESSARTDEKTAREAIGKLRERERDERRHFEEQRDGVVPLNPPAAARTELVADWEQLVKWAGTQVPKLTKDAAAARAKARKTSARRDDLLKALAESCIECGVEIEGEDVKVATITAATNARTKVAEISKGIATVDKLRVSLDAKSLEHEVAASLAQHLKASGFERWLVGEALLRLVEGATSILRELSDDQYSLAIDGNGNFLVTDHHNANEARSARTLSGGETFLASLALALALSDQLVELAAQGSARLEAIFLDEGFGTLDPETLDTAEASIANLAASGRMVGVITHVRDLADRIPLQFRVTKDTRTSTVERIEA
jgi:DNA repair protein SbcC/Rad50